VDFPYSEQQLVDEIGKKVMVADRKKVESLEIVDEAKKMDVALLVYGSPLIATTHITLIQEAMACGIKYRIIQNASIIDAVAETGLQIYKFGKIASMPEWKKSYEPDSFMEIVKENQSIKAHSLILIDIGLDIKKAIEQLEKSAKKHDVKLSKLIICQCLGTKRQKIMYREIDEVREFSGVQKPYCIIIPGELHFLEKKFLRSFE
jgi:diphthine synthase